jgi:hypothetical protein
MKDPKKSSVPPLRVQFPWVSRSPGHVFGCLAAGLAACFTSPVANGAFACGIDDLCPSGYVCASDKLCRPDGTSGLEPDAGAVDDAPAASDAAPDLGFTPSNFPRDRIGASAAIVQLDVPAVFDTDRGLILDAATDLPLAIPGVVFRSVAQTNAPAIGVFSMGSLRIASGIAVKVRGAAAFAIAATGDITIAGVLDGSAVAAAPGAGGGGGGATASSAGAGSGAGKTCNAAASVTDGCGGSGGGFAGRGGDAGVRPGRPVPTGGVSYGNVSLTPLRGGSGGAAGSMTIPSPISFSATGGGGGGAIQLVSFGQIRVSGQVVAAGAGGGKGMSSGGGSGGGGGGAGGGILLEAIGISVTGILAANGGAGGAASSGSPASTAGQSGLASLSAARGGISADGSSGGGGDGSSAVQGSGLKGVNGATFGGGGGGGGGRIALRARAQVVLTGAIVSPPALSEPGAL